MNSLYGVECGLPARLDAPNNSISFDADTIAAALVNIYQKKYGNGREIEPTLFEKTKEIFNNAVSKGWNAGGSPAVKRNSAFVDALKHNTDVFSAFRVHKMQSDIAAQLLDEKGNLKPFGKFVKDVKPYISHQNRAWLETEYNTAVLRAHQAADWKQFEAEKDVLPNLEWQPSTSPNPGEDHKPYWFTVLPVDHKFWTQHRPGDRWNCKCNLRNTDKPATAVPTETLVKNLQPSKGLDTNPGTTGEIFSNSHPYYPENCGKCPFNKGVGKLFAALVGKKGKHCSNCKNTDGFSKKERPFWTQDEKLKPYQVDNNDFKAIKKTWDIPFKNAKEMNESAIGGFNILRFEKVIDGALNYLKQKGEDIINDNKKVVKKIARYNDGSIHFIYHSNGIKMYRVFKQNKIVNHTYFKCSYPNKGFGSIVMNECLKQYNAMNITKITLIASSANGGYTWAKMSFWADNRNEILRQINNKQLCPNKPIRDKMRTIIADYYKKNGNAYNKPFPMKLLANKDMKEYLTHIKWSGFLNLTSNRHLHEIIKYLKCKLSTMFNSY